MTIGFLVEREEQLEALQSVIAGSDDAGKVVLLSGEAGFGKTSILKVALDALDHRHTVLFSACEPVGIPVAFAPLFDLLDAFPADLRQDLRNGSSRSVVHAGMLDLLKNDHVVLVIDDLHWGDEATMGLIRYLGRRISATNSTLIATYRSEEVDLAHPFRMVVADLGRDAARIELPPLSVSGVAQLSLGIDVDPEELHAATLGNPFFVEEVLRNRGTDLPPTVQNAVLSSAAQLPEPGLEILHLAALGTDGVDLALLLAEYPGAGACIDQAVQRKLLVVERGRARCRHDLIRESLNHALPPVMKQRLHQRLLGFLENGSTDSPDIAKLAYHSLGAGDVDKGFEYSVQAARAARKAGAHRQAAFHFSNAVESGASGVPDEKLTDVLLEAAQEHCLINAFDTAVELSARRVGRMTSEFELAKARAWNAYFHSRQNDLSAVRREANLAVEVLRSRPSSLELALALAAIAWVDLVEGKWKEAIRLGDEAVAIAREADAPNVEVHAATTAGTARSYLDDRRGLVEVAAAVELGTTTEAEEFASRAMNNLGLINLEAGFLNEARLHFDRLIEYTTAHQLDAWYIAALATRAWINVMAGRWFEADLDLERVLGQRTCIQTELEVLVTAASLRARRGDPGSTEAIEAALGRIEGSADIVNLVLGCALALEGSWIGVIPLDVAREWYEGVCTTPALADYRSGRSILAFWARRLDLEPPAGSISGPAGREWAGAVDEAAEAWEHKSFPVHAAVTRAMVPGADLNAVFSDLSSLGAEGVLRGLRRELKRRGVRPIPRGTRPATRVNPAGLTDRQLEVLELMASGFSNSAISEELFISEKTAGHHVSAVLSKLNASSRLQAVATAHANGWTDTGSQAPI